MAHIHQFPRYSGAENFATSHTLLLLGRVYQYDRNLFERFINKLLDGGEITIGPSFFQQESSGGYGIPDGIIQQRSLKIVLETKLYDQNFWGKEEYHSHFSNEETRVLLALSINGLKETRKEEIQNVLNKYDQESSWSGSTQLIDVTFSDIVKALRELIGSGRSKAQFELEEILDDYEGFACDYKLISDTDYRMHVFAINTSEEDNTEYNLYYNYAHRNESPHRFIGLYRNKRIKYIAEVKTVVIPTKQPNGSMDYKILKGKEHFHGRVKENLDRFLKDEYWGFDGKTKFHLFEKLCPTNFKKISPGGIMGPRHFNLKDYVLSFPSVFNDDWIAKELDGKEWE